MKNLNIASCIDSLVSELEASEVSYCLNATDEVLSTEGDGWNLEVFYSDTFAEVEFNIWTIEGRDLVRQILIHFEGLKVAFESVCQHESGKEVFIRFMAA